MKKIFFIILIFLFSCEGFLDEDIRSLHNYDNYFQSEDDLISLANGMFGQLISWDWDGGGLFFNNYWVLQDLASDNCYEDGPDINMHDLSRFTFDANNEVFGFIWSACYAAINTSNVLLKEIKNIEDYSSEDVKNHLAGEAYFIRGMLHFELVKLFGDIPLQITATTEIENTKIKRTPVEEVYENIISDLKNAEELLVNNPFQNRVEGMPTSLTASALLGKVYLQRGALKNNDSDFDLAKEYLEKVIGNYTLEPEFADIFKIENANQGEIIWAVNFSGTLGEGWGTSQLIVRLMPTMVSDSGSKNGQGWEKPTETLYNSFSNTDKRKDVTFITEFAGEVFDDPHISKFWDREAEGGRQNGESDVDFIYLRYADVLLMYAEALNEIHNGPTTAAYNSINDVRNRANLPNLTSGLNYQQFKDSVLQERQLEFVMEGQRWYDLIRHKKLKEKVEDAKEGIVVNDWNILFAIPQKEIYYNNNLTQNTGY